MKIISVAIGSAAHVRAANHTVAFGWSARAKAADSTVAFGSAARGKVADTTVASGLGCGVDGDELGVTAGASVALSVSHPLQPLRRGVRDRGIIIITRPFLS